MEENIVMFVGKKEKKKSKEIIGIEKNTNYSKTRCWLKSLKNPLFMRFSRVFPFYYKSPSNPVISRVRGYFLKRVFKGNTI